MKQRLNGLSQVNFRELLLPTKNFLLNGFQILFLIKQLNNLLLLLNGFVLIVTVVGRLDPALSGCICTLSHMLHYNLPVPFSLYLKNQSSDSTLWI